MDKPDVIVIGGGASGMMAAGQASKNGARVLLIEKNNRLGEKLLITGGGRCNVTNAELDTRKLLEKFEDASDFLFSAFSQWNVENTLDFFHSRDMPTKIENEKRVFPTSDKAESVWNVLLEFLKQGNVEIMSNTEVKGLEIKDNRIAGVKVKGNKILEANSYILATGGLSRPETGSTGDGFKWLEEIGHTISTPKASLVPVKIKDKWVKDLQGITLPEIKITLYQNNEKQESKKGKILFTHFGVTGPTILNMSNDIDELLKYGEVIIELDLLPQYDYGQLNLKLQEIFKENPNKKIKNTLGEIILNSLVDIILEKSEINPDIANHSITREERLKLVQTLKHIRMEATGLLGTDKAIITSGGVDLKEIDFKTMQSRLFPNLYIIGDLLNINRPSGGYSLQLCWTTGSVAGKHAALQK